MAQTNAQLQRSTRQDALREQIAAHLHHQQVAVAIAKIEALDPADPNFRNCLEKPKASADLRFKLLAKYLPDLKSSEITADVRGIGHLVIVSQPGDADL